jgi:hypothetical protein
LTCSAYYRLDNHWENRNSNVSNVKQNDIALKTARLTEGRLREGSRIEGGQVRTGLPTSQLLNIKQMTSHCKDWKHDSRQNRSYVGLDFEKGLISTFCQLRFVPAVKVPQKKPDPSLHCYEC